MQNLNKTPWHSQKYVLTNGHSTKELPIMEMATVKSLQESLFLYASFTLANDFTPPILRNNHLKTTDSLTSSI